jgi:alpha-galactosidase
MKKMKWLFLPVFGLSVLIMTADTNALENGLARTPPMGFNTWNWFKCGTEPGRGAINEALIKGIADAMVSTGMKEAGYEYVNIDDCWGESSRNASGGLVPSRANFPNGMKVVADYVHSKGLKLGVYTDVANLTCAKTMPGMLGHENQDADTFVAWGVDYVKVDWCNVAAGASAVQEFTKVRNALRSAVTRMKPAVPSAHEIVFSICNWGNQSPWLWGDTVGNLWRTTGDIDWNTYCKGTPCWSGVLLNMDGTASLARYAGPGRWNDPDMLEVGNDPITVAQSRSHFSLWCMMAAPLIAGNDIRNMNATIKSILTNSDVIRVDQDSLGRQGVRLTTGNSEIWVRKLSSTTAAKTDTNYAVLFFNRNNSAPVSMSVTAAQIASAVGGGITNGKVYKVRNLWTHQDLPDWTAGTLTSPAPVPLHDVVMLRLSPLSTSSTVFAEKSFEGKLLEVARGKITINPGRSGGASVSLCDLKGAVVSSQKTAGTGPVFIHTSGLNRGIYILTVAWDGDFLARRVLLK